MKLNFLLFTIAAIALFGYGNPDFVNDFLPIAILSAIAQIVVACYIAAAIAIAMAIFDRKNSR